MLQTAASTDIRAAATAEVEAFLADEAGKTLLRFLTCGSVDDGKSTLIGRLLYDSQMILEDQMKTLAADSKKVGTTGGDLDLALLVDGLQAEREQGITIDVAYRFFATPHRKFIVADTPGHIQYTRNMATGASNSDVAVILIDARKGVITQTRRHSFIVSLLGIRHVALAINKMDLVDYSQEVFNRIVADFQDFAKALNFASVTPVPVSALKGDNCIHPSEHMDWYHGPTLIGFLETVDATEARADQPFRMPVQWVNRPDQHFRGFSGTIGAGRVRPGDPIIALPSARTSTVARIVTHSGDLDAAEADDAVTITLADEIDISRGDVLANPATRPEVTDQFSAHLIWMAEEPMLPGRPYLIKCGAQTATTTITSLRYRVDVNTLERLAGHTLDLNEVGVCHFATDKPLVFDAYKDCRATGHFIIIDKISNATVGAGMIKYGLRRASNIHWQAMDVTPSARAEIKGQKPTCLWFTGLSGSGKSTVANLLDKRLFALGRHAYLLDGDNVRHGLNRDLGFTDADRVENIRRVSEVAKLMADAGLIVLVAFISPFRAERQFARGLFAEGEFLEVFVDTPLAVCEARDVKGLYKKARAGQIANFTGISSPYEAPEAPEVHLDGAGESTEAMVETIIAQLKASGRI